MKIKLFLILFSAFAHSDCVYGLDTVPEELKAIWVVDESKSVDRIINHYEKTSKDHLGSVKSAAKIAEIKKLDFFVEITGEIVRFPVQNVGIVALHPRKVIRVDNQIEFDFFEDEYGLKIRTSGESKILEFSSNASNFQIVIKKLIVLVEQSPKTLVGSWNYNKKKTLEHWGSLVENKRMSEVYIAVNSVRFNEACLNVFERGIELQLPNNRIRLGHLAPTREDGKTGTVTFNTGLIGKFDYADGLLRLQCKGTIPFSIFFEKQKKDSPTAMDLNRCNGTWKIDLDENKSFYNDLVKSGLKSRDRLSDAIKEFGESVDQSIVIGQSSIKFHDSQSCAISKLVTPDLRNTNVKLTDGFQFRLTYVSEELILFDPASDVFDFVILRRVPK